MFAVHARGAFLCYKYAIRQMIKQGRGGRVVGACSLSGLRGKPNDAHYCAAKFAIRGLTQSVGTSILISQAATHIVCSAGSGKTRYHS